MYVILEFTLLFLSFHTYIRDLVSDGDVYIYINKVSKYLRRINFIGCFRGRFCPCKKLSQF